MDLLGSILNAMDKQGPPKVNQKEKLLRQQMKLQQEKQLKLEKQQLADFRQKIEDAVTKFSQDSSAPRHVFPAMEKIHRSIAHDVAEVAGLPAYSFGDEGIDRHVQIFKRESAPTEMELDELRRCPTSDLKVAKEQVLKRKLEEQEEEKEKARAPQTFKPTTDYKEKYEHLIGRDAAKDAAKRTVTNKQYGFVPSENKKDQRSIEQTLADLRERKRQKVSHEEAAASKGEGSAGAQSSSTPQ